ncbi:MAG: hypothetical protein CMO01_01105 [Thalassobius sp.]|nr:hypothetical protein [Thalassovita sp.]
MPRNTPFIGIFWVICTEKCAKNGKNQRFVISSKNISVLLVTISIAILMDNYSKGREVVL